MFSQYPCVKFFLYQEIRFLQLYLNIHKRQNNQLFQFDIHYVQNFFEEKHRIRRKLVFIFESCPRRAPSNTYITITKDLIPNGLRIFAILMALGITINTSSMRHILRLHLLMFSYKIQNMRK